MARAGFSGLQITEFRNNCNILNGRETCSVTLRGRHRRGLSKCGPCLILYVTLIDIAIIGCGPPCSVSEELLKRGVRHRLEGSKCLKSLNDNLQFTTAENLECMDTLSFIGQAGRTFSVQCKFMEERENTVPLRCRIGHLKLK